MSDDLERRLADALRGERLPDAPDTLRAFVERLPTEADARTPERRFRLVWLAPAPVVVAVAALLFALVPRTTAPPAGSPSPSASATAISAIVWSKVANTGDGILVDGDTVMSAIAFDGGYVMVGNADRADHAAWWYSPDGTTWQRHDADLVFANSLLQWIVRVPDGLLIVGTANQLDSACGGGAFGCNPVSAIRMWSSSDGRTWQRLPGTDLAVFGRAGLGAVVSGPSGLVAFGAQAPAQGPGTPMVWTSSDGRTWSAARQFYSAFPSAVVDDVVATATAFVAVGRPDNPSGPTGSGAAWYSSDGQTWHAAAGVTHELSLALGAQAGALAHAFDSAGNPSMWATADGSAWSGMTGGPFTLADRSPSFISDGSRILALGTDRSIGTPAAWLSSDAQHWQELPENGELPELDPTGAVGALSPNDVVLVTTTTTPSSGFTTSIWFGSFGLTPTPEPTATPARIPSASGPVDLAGTSQAGSLWAIRGLSWLVSADSGASWQEHPVPVPATKLMTATALDAAHAWLVSVGAGGTQITGAPTDVLRYVVWQTSDAGATWRSTTVPGNYAGHTPVLSFVDAEHGYLLAAEQRFSDGISGVLSTSDGGLTWSQVGSVPSLGSEFIASDASTLWAGAEGEAGPVAHPMFEVSRDAGRTWAEVALPGITPHQEGGPTVYLPGPPVFLSALIGAVAVTTQSRGTPHTTIYRTTDGGATWTLASDQPVEASCGLALIDEADWFLPVDNPFALLSSTDAGASWRRVVTNGLANGGWVIWIGALDGGNLASLVPTGHSYPGSTLLYESGDGGRTWAPRL